MPRKHADLLWLRISVYPDFIILVALISIRFQSWDLMFLQKIPSNAVPSHSGAPWLTVCLPIKHKSQPFPSQFSPAFNVWKSMTLNQMNSSRFEKVCVKMYPHADELRTNRIEGRRGGEQRGGECEATLSLIVQPLCVSNRFKPKGKNWKLRRS